MDTDCVIGMLVLGLGTTAMFLGYKAKFDKKGVQLEKNDKEHEKKHQHNETRIKELEKKNGAEQHQIDAQAEEITQLKAKLDKKDIKYKELKGEIRLIKAMMTLSEEARQKQLKEQESDSETEDEWED